MRDDEDFGQFLPLLRRVIILVAVITAIPVVLWTITAFVRTYVGPPALPTFHQLASKASLGEPAPANANQGPSAPERTAMAAAAPAKPAVTAPAPTPVPAPVAASAPAAVDAAAPKGPFLGDHPPEIAANVQPAAPAIAPPAMSATATLAPKAADTAPPAQMAAVQPPAAMAAAPADPAPPAQAVVVQEPAPAIQPPSLDAVAAAPPLAGPVPLPRRRPHGIAEANSSVPATETTAAPTRMASNGPIPMPRPRPDGAGPGAPAADTGGGPLGFISNIFGGSK